MTSNGFWRLERPARGNAGSSIPFLYRAAMHLAAVGGAVLVLAVAPGVLLGQASELQLTPDRVSLEVGKRQAIYAAAYDRQGNIVSSAVIAFSSSDTTVATVSKKWPDEVRVEVVERVPVAWTNTDTGWTRRAIDGVALPSEEEPTTELPHVDMTELAEVAAATSPDMLAALEFVAALAPGLEDGAVVHMHEGELWAEVSGFSIRLGRADEMTEKALSLAGLLRQQIPEGSVIVMIATTNPSVLTPSGAAAAAAAEQASQQSSEDASNDDGETSDD